MMTDEQNTALDDNGDEDLPLDEVLDDDAEMDETTEDGGGFELTISRRTLIGGAVGLLALIAVVLGLFFFVLDRSPTLITVNDRTMSVEEFQRNVKFEYYLQTGGQPLDQLGVTAEQFTDFARDTLINTMLIWQVAEERGLEVTQDAVDEQTEQVFGFDRENPEATQEDYDTSRAEFFDAAAEATGLEPDVLRTMWDERVRTVLLIEAIIDDMTLAVDETEEAVRGAHILVETEDEADDVLQRLEDGEEFEALAEELSLDTASGEQGGELGWFTRGMMVAPFEEAAFALEAGEISDPIQTQFGWHIITIFEKDDVAVAEDQQANQERELFRAELEQWRETATIEVDEELYTESIPELP